MLPTEATIDPHGNVSYRQRFGGALSARFDLRDFPFDHQTLPIIVVSLLYGPDQVSLGAVFSLVAFRLSLRGSSRRLPT